VKIGGGALNCDVDAACASHGLAVTLGNAPSVGCIGATMGGGVGFMARWIGLTIDSLLSATLVLANGSIVEASPDGNDSNLFWEIRGGGGNFGIVVSFTLKAVKMGWDDSKGPGRLLTGVRVVRHAHGAAICFGNGIGAAAGKVYFIYT